MPKRPEIWHGASFNHRCNAARDVVEMPNMGQFENAEHYFSTIYHEPHATGRKSRLNRFEKRAGESREERYGFEEIVAELGTTFLSATCGLDNSSRLEDAIAYLAGWLKLRADKKLFLQPAGAAQQTANFILGRAEERAGEGRAALANKQHYQCPNFSYLLNFSSGHYRASGRGGGYNPIHADRLSEQDMIVLLYLVHARRNLFPRNYLRFLLFLASPNRADIETTT